MPISTKSLAALPVTLLVFLGLFACRPEVANQTQNQGNDLDAMDQSRVTIGNQAFEVWLARTSDETEKGLMFVEKSQMEPLEDGTERGMLFIFERERFLGFWMRNTIIPLDIAYARSDGTIVSIHTMTPLDLNTYPSGQPARFALEVNAGLFAQLGVKAGDRIAIPDSVLESDP